eukprot:CAMPEP_0183353008 /NCGR_PEP_ID=MMETSP0164_2-20130417/32083_1 /TAXON_ID=221442 /ORGANISM="Coccolithus pelagicus ssp braarudi, Strain PLY182g" /LENGTH=76 /DNA_ID=CAMNT_0025525599 /DNA_START=438 /DNA_END=668 /DNA_ORIENTATION=+
MRAVATFGDPERVKERATRRVAAAADPTAEHARLACAMAPLLPGIGAASLEAAVQSSPCMRVRRAFGSTTGPVEAS